MYRRLQDSQKTAASTLFRQMTLLSAAGAGYQYVNGSIWDVLLTVVLTIVFGGVSIDILKDLNDNANQGGERGD